MSTRNGAVRSWPRVKILTLRHLGENPHFGYVKMLPTGLGLVPRPTRPRPHTRGLAPRTFWHPQNCLPAKTNAKNTAGLHCLSLRSFAGKLQVLLNSTEGADRLTRCVVLLHRHIGSARDCFCVTPMQCNATAASILTQWGYTTARRGSTTLVAASLGVCSHPQADF